MHAAGTHRGRHGFGLGGSGSIGGRGRGDVPGGRKLGSTDLQLVILALLAEAPAHGYELIRIIEERSGGFYAPSPGMIYPALSYLGEIGRASVEPEGGRKRYHLTAEGAAHLAANRGAADAIFEALSRIGSRMEEVREAFAGIGDAEGGASDQVHLARQALKHALRRKRGCDAREARRIATILNRATAEILGAADRTPDGGLDDAS